MFKSVQQAITVFFLALFCFALQTGSVILQNHTLLVSPKGCWVCHQNHKREVEDLLVFTCCLLKRPQTFSHAFRPMPLLSSPCIHVVCLHPLTLHLFCCAPCCVSCFPVVQIGWFLSAAPPHLHVGLVVRYECTNKCSISLCARRCHSAPVCMWVCGTAILCGWYLCLSCISNQLDAQT